MILERKIWMGLTLVATGGIALAGLTGCGGGGEAGEGGEAAAHATQGSEGGEGGEGGEHGPPGQGGEGGEGGEAGTIGDYPGGNFSVALKKVLAGEGGEGGVGFTKSGRAIATPALDDAQLSQAFSGNTLHGHKHFAYYFDPSGTVQGWEVQWTQVGMDQCKGLEKTQAKNTGLGDGSIHLFDAECWRKSIPKTTAGKWAVRDGMLCTEPALQAVTGAGRCGTVFMVFNRLAVYDASDEMVGKGGELSPGNKTGET